MNNLKLLTWTEPTAEKVSVKLRIHSGAAFDLQNKEGTMALLADILFPNEAAKEFFREDLGGSLDVMSNYDYIQINATGRADQILVILETLANAVTKPLIDKETTAKVRAARIEKVKELEKNPSHVADQAVAKRLFGSFPYGRSADGTTESLAKIDFADLLLAKQRFLTADNATLAVSGRVKSDFVFKAVRQLFGGWEKSDKKIPATFALPNAVATNSFLMPTENENVSELRLAFRGLARNDKDFAASEILTKVLNNRVQLKEGNKAMVYQIAHLLPSFVVLKVSDWNIGTLKIEGENAALPQNFFETIGNLLKAEIKPDEFEKAKSEIVAERNKINSADLWLDLDTFKLVSVKDEMQTPSNVTIADVQKVVERWKKESVVAALVVSKSK
ncbi:MAG: insulinase family protein [Acidobacteriota bacterium]|nr:insulinase family protein [Acidobacteriota bacterium]